MPDATPPPLLISDVQKRVADELDRMSPLIDELGERFSKAGHEIALVGGPVRDAMLGRLHNDLDFATSARPEVTEKLLKGWADAIWDIGRAYGAQVTPHMYVIKGDGTLVYMGGIDDKPSTKIEDIPGAKNFVDEALAEVKAGKPVSVTTARPYGCTVKYQS